MEEVRLIRGSDGFLHTSLKSVEHQIISPSPKWASLLAYLSQAHSVSEAARVIKQGGLEVNGKIINDPVIKLDTSVAGTYEVRIGKKKFLRIVVE